jgi:tRNA pseudouridine55 synthase
MKQPEREFAFDTGELLLVDKPLTWTSFDVVNYIRALIRRFRHPEGIKVGHAGTLDPLATGLLLLCTGKMTRQIQFLQDMDKVYTGTLKLGLSTPSYDLETEPDATFPTGDITPEMVEAALRTLEGNLQQLPPVYSAVKINGKRAFNYARKNKEVKLEARSVQVHSFRITENRFPELDFKVHCSKGTYIRSLVHDFGIALGNGAVLTALRRTAIGDYNIADAWNLDDLKAAIIGNNGSSET